MRADRLLSLLMLLQTRGRVTAQVLADELEVSVRTIYRDMDALSSAGVPVYAEAGPGGGCALLEDYRTTLTGLNDEEVRALFMLSVPALLGELGFGAELRSALLKLRAALPATRQQDEAWVRQRIYLDWSSWRPAEPTPFLATIQAAVWADRRLRLVYHRQINAERQRFDRVVEPYALVAKAGAWHLVCAADGRLRVYPVASLDEALPLEEHFVRPDGFDLIAYWQQWCVENAGHEADYRVRVRVAPPLLADPAHVGHAGARTRIAALGRAWLATAHAPDAWPEVELAFDSFWEARSHLLALGGSVEVLTPLPLRLSLEDYARQIVKLYTPPSTPPPNGTSGRK